MATGAILAGLAVGAWFLTWRQVSGAMAPPAAPLFMAMWLTMMVGMMFPAIAPMVLTHRRVVISRGEGALPTVSFVAGYLAVWTAVGLLPLAGLLAFHSLISMADPRWFAAAAAGALVVAGVYQFTPWKAACLRSCRSPLGFLLNHDFGGGSPAAFRAGLHHGAYCLGCCWALMAVLVVVGLMNLVWMAAIAVVILIEKNWRYGVGLSRAAGGASVALGAGVFLAPGLLTFLGGGTMAG